MGVLWGRACLVLPGFLLTSKCWAERSCYGTGLGGLPGGAGGVSHLVGQADLVGPGPAVEEVPRASVGWGCLGAQRVSAGAESGE